MGFIGNSDLSDGNRLAKKALTLDGTTPVTLFTVTGMSEVRIYAVCSINCAAVADNLSVGISGSTQLFIVNTACQDVDAGEIWLDATPATSYVPTDSLPKPAVINGTNIIFTGHANANSGQIDFYCVYRPLSANASIIAA